MPARPLHITPELLREAWGLRTRPGWPADFESVLRHPLCSRLLRCEAIALLLRRDLAEQAERYRVATSIHHQRPLPLDRKRAAAGEREDD